MLGDVSGAFRHVPVHENEVHMFAFAYDGYVVIDLSCGFGWCGSPAFYALAGTTINDIYEISQPESKGCDDEGHFHGSVWCDDHTCVEVNTGTRCRDANIALRRAMATVLGSTSINDKKFMPWRSINKALGLIWNTATGTVSIPTEKLDKASRLVAQLLESGRASKSELNKQLGVFRHVVTCFPAARAFNQRTHVESVVMPQFGKRQLHDEIIEDLRWFNAVLVHRDRFNSIPVAQFATDPTPSIHVYMDASNTGFCALEPQRREFIRVQYTKEECDALASGTFDRSINIRELQSAVLEALLWGPKWQHDARAHPVYVRLHIDNTSAVAWSSRRYSRHPTAQLYNRLLSITELQFQLSISAEHIPGTMNTMADAGSRAWSESHTLWSTWSNLSSSWQQVHVEEPYNNLSHQWRRFSKLMGCAPWCRRNGSSSSRKLAYFAIYLWKYGWNKRGHGNHYSTIQSKVSSIIWYHRRFSGVELSRSPQLAILLRGIKRLKAPVSKKQPVSPAFLRLIRRSLHFTRPRDRLLWGSVLLGYFFLLRRSEYLALGNSQKFYCLRTKDVFFTNSRGIRVEPDLATSVTIGLSGAENDQYGRGAWRTMHQTSDRLLCPVKALKHLLRARRELKCEGHKYLCADLDASTVSQALKTTASRAGVPAANYSTHSLRSGGATSLLASKADSLAIKLLGRWMPRCYEEYPVQSAASTTGLSSRMI